MTEKERHIFNWIHEVSKVREELNGFAICPFATSSKYRIVECPARTIEPIENLDVIIYVIEDEYLKEILEDDYDIIETRDSNPVKSSDFNESGAQNGPKTT